MDLNGTEHKIAQFSDDTQVTNTGDKLSFEKICANYRIIWKGIWAVPELGKDTSNMAWEQN